MKTPIGSLDPAIREVHIWGGGIAGLLMGHFLSRQGHYIHLYEVSPRVGGKIQSLQLPSGITEAAANALYATPEMENWLTNDLGLKPLRATEKLKRRLWDQFPRSPLTAKLILKVISRLFRRTPAVDDQVTVADFFRPLLGQDVEQLLSPALQGIYACGAEQLALAGVWPQLKAGRYWQVLRGLRGPRARSVSFQNGMQEFIEALAGSIQGKIYLNYSQNFTLRPNTLICTEAHSAAKLLAECWPTGSQALTRLRYLPISSATALVPSPPETQKTFGYLFPRSSGVHSLGVLFNQEIFPNRTGMTFILAANQAIEEKVAADLQTLHWPLASLKIHSWGQGLPCYDANRNQVLNSLMNDPTRPAELVLFGNYVAGISLRDMVTVAQEFAQKPNPVSPD